MPLAAEYFNNNVAIEGDLVIKTVPNNTGSVLVWNATTKKVSTRTASEIINDLNLAVANHTHSNLVPYTGANQAVNLNSQSLIAGNTFINQLIYSRATNISNTDLNIRTLAGFYDGENLTNAPNLGWFYIAVERYNNNPGWVKQTVTSFGSGNTANKTYQRVNVGGTWGTWDEIVFKSELNNYVASKIYAGSYNANSLTTNSITYGFNVTNAPSEVGAHSFSILNLDTASADYKMQVGFDADTNKMYSRTLNGGNWSTWKGYSYSDHTHQSLYSDFTGIVDANTLFEDFKFKYYQQINSGSTNMFPTYNNANTVISIASHPGGYGAQIGFNDNNEIFFKRVSAGTFDTWRQFAFQPWVTSNFIPLSQKGVANGVATLDSSGLIPASQLPSYVDDVLEYANLASFPATGESGKIYVALNTNLTYRWGGSSYTQIASGAVQSVNGQTGVVNLTKSDIGLGNVDNTSDLNKPISTSTQNALNGKVNNLENATGIGFTSGNINLAPYFMHSSGARKYLATQDWVSSGFVPMNSIFDGGYAGHGVMICSSLFGNESGLMDGGLERSIASTDGYYYKYGSTIAGFEGLNVNPNTNQIGYGCEPTAGYRHQFEGDIMLSEGLTCSIGTGEEVYGTDGNLLGLTHEIKRDPSTNSIRLNRYIDMVSGSSNTFATDMRDVHVTMLDGGNLTMDDIFPMQRITITNAHPTTSGYFAVNNTSIGVNIPAKATAEFVVHVGNKMVQLGLMENYGQVLN